MSVVSRERERVPFSLIGPVSPPSRLPRTHSTVTSDEHRCVGRRPARVGRGGWRGAASRFRRKDPHFRHIPALSNSLVGVQNLLHRHQGGRARPHGLGLGDGVHERERTRGGSRERVTKEKRRECEPFFFRSASPTLSPSCFLRVCVNAPRVVCIRSHTHARTPPAAPALHTNTHTSGARTPTPPPPFPSAPAPPCAHGTRRAAPQCWLLAPGVWNARAGGWDGEWRKGRGKERARPRRAVASAVGTPSHTRRRLHHPFQHLHHTHTHTHTHTGACSSPAPSRAAPRPAPSPPPLPPPRRRPRLRRPKNPPPAPPPSWPSPLAPSISPGGTWTSCGRGRWPTMALCGGRWSSAPMATPSGNPSRNGWTPPLRRREWTTPTFLSSFRCRFWRRRQRTWTGLRQSWPSSRAAVARNWRNPSSSAPPLKPLSTTCLPSGLRRTGTCR